ncbi:hypothetical protein SSX86_022705 [Deinandra increscens subsp. villosa]|uniref:Uncharacterized protein n=1 Tax=Deinandra increscens subsp. villosa TaxID=3103831 RepID=A0AAP0CJK3_9ASTR
MEGLTAKVYNGVKCYWRTRRYHGLVTTAAVYGDQQRRERRRTWRSRLNPRLKLKLPRSPKNLFISLRGGYVRIMMKLANTSVIRGRTMTGGYDGDGFGKATTSKECDGKVIVEILIDRFVSSSS